MLPIAETFTSIHGEGKWAGTAMTFLRLAGCTVGKFYNNHRPRPERGPKPLMPILDTGFQAFTCTTYDGREFPCDTDYRKTESITLDAFIARIPSGIKHICLTGGEPLMHVKQLEEEQFINRMKGMGMMVHVETSGTIIPPKYWRERWNDQVYFTCSPKLGVKEEFLTNWADEIRIMVDSDFELSRLPVPLQTMNGQIYFCPISDKNDVTKFDPKSLQRCINLVLTHPWTKISIQQHKVLNVR